ncbi:hypothetical protein ACFWBF_01760 [Streptomyces sp. NPDC060028]|uniref:hypothetical protein n=1 Tax=Streptomyces sp. NPDC060028 TaxID=3347041 RepID=UPI0036A45F0B
MEFVAGGKYSLSLASDGKRVVQVKGTSRVSVTAATSGAESDMWHVVVIKSGEGGAVVKFVNVDTGDTLTTEGFVLAGRTVVAAPGDDQSQWILRQDSKSGSVTVGLLGSPERLILAYRAPASAWLASAGDLEAALYGWKVQLQA